MKIRSGRNSIGIRENSEDCDHEFQKPLALCYIEQKAPNTNSLCNKNEQKRAFFIYVHEHIGCPRDVIIFSYS